jgi:hypothetical protein
MYGGLRKSILRGASLCTYQNALFWAPACGWGVFDNLVPGLGMEDRVMSGSRPESLDSAVAFMFLVFNYTVPKGRFYRSGLYSNHH